MRAFFLSLLLFITVLASVVVTGQTSQTSSPSAQSSDQAITPNGAIGEVKAIDSIARQLIVKTDAGSLVTVAVSDKTIYMRTAPGEKTLTNAIRIALADVAEGDRVWARGKVSEDKKSVPALAVVVMTRADISKKQEQERAEWRRRGILGVITTLKPETKEITISTRTMLGSQPVNIPVSDKVEMRRYAPDSIKFSDAKACTFDELKVGDQLRALGERTPDGTRFTAEKIVTGAFRTVAGIVSSVDLATSEIKIDDLQTKQPLTVVVKSDSVVRKFPSSGNGGMAMAGQGPVADTPSVAQGVARPEQAPGSGRAPRGSQAGGTGMRMGGGGGGIQEMLERLPTAAIAEVKVGDTIIVSSTKGADPSRLTAITLVTGADTLLNMLAVRQQQQTGGQAGLNPAAGLGTGITFGIGLP